VLGRHEVAERLADQLLDRGPGQLGRSGVGGGAAALRIEGEDGVRVLLEERLEEPVVDRGVAPGHPPGERTATEREDGHSSRRGQQDGRRVQRPQRRCGCARRERGHGPPGQRDGGGQRRDDAGDHGGP